jgi:hypothetical protein
MWGQAMAAFQAEAERVASARQGAAHPAHQLTASSQQ